MPGQPTPPMQYNKSVEPIRVHQVKALENP